MRTSVAVKAAEELHARSKGYLTLVQVNCQQLVQKCEEAYRVFPLSLVPWCYHNNWLFCSLAVLALAVLAQAPCLHVTLPRHYHDSPGYRETLVERTKLKTKLA